MTESAMMPVMRPNREDLEMQMAGATATTAPLNSYADTLGGNDSISLSDTIADAPINVLLVEDDEGDAYLIEKALNKNRKVGHIVRARDGEEALEMIASGSVHPDLALIDLQMPRKDGFSLLLEMQKYDVDCTCVALTSSRSGADSLRCFHRGARMFVSKPKQPEQLSALLNEVIREL